MPENVVIETEFDWGFSVLKRVDSRNLFDNVCNKIWREKSVMLIMRFSNGQYGLSR